MSNHVEAQQQRGYDIGLLLLRACLGLTMAAHGAQHLFGWFGGVGLAITAKSFSANGYLAADVMAVVAAVSELLGGLGLALGLLTPLAAAAIIGTMINATAVKWSNGFFIPKGVEYEIVLAVAAAALALTGPGRFAADSFLPVLRAHRLRYGVSAVALAVVSGVVVLLTRS
ncbi:DoxX family protein [Lentzea aerocolonigenes]|uniref:DoxX family protein n=1 Tax=Lentzea aerocolonigenes TaxID=68170 RepID=A0A0F0GYS3_LENAE|nr:DoxX family membrane protein [Lentzea aerocolonigenes]KJK48614.1 DoxX family protein [Lentzea aerocolonigenes]